MNDLMIPSSFDNFQQRKLSRGIETMSETYYNGYIIRLRCYPLSGISGKILKVLDSGKRKVLRERNYNFKLPEAFLFELKSYIDNYEDRLISKLIKAGLSE